MSLVDRHNQTDCMAHRVKQFNTAWRATTTVLAKATKKYIQMGREVGVVPKRGALGLQVRETLDMRYHKSVCFGVWKRVGDLD